MLGRALILLVGLSHLQASVLHPRDRGAGRLAEALRVIQTEKRHYSQNEGADTGYYGNPYGWNYGSQDNYGAMSDDYMNGGQEFYDDYSKLSPADMRLLDYYYDQGSRSDETESNGPVDVEDGDDVREVDQKEIKDLLNSDKEKKNIDWTPKALGFEGLKHKRGESETGSDVTDQAANEETEGDKEEVDKGSVGESELTDDEVNKLLSDTDDADVTSVAKTVEVEDVNGETTVSGKEVASLLKDTDNDGQKEEVVLEKDLPPTKVNDLNKELLIGQELVGAGVGKSRKQKRAGGFLEEAMTGYSQPEEDVIPTEQQLLRDCLIRYIELEDRENTALAEALNWATKAQYDQTDVYIPMQVDYLRKAVQNEAMLSEVRRQCFALANQIDEQTFVSDLEEDEALDEEAEGFPLDDDTSDIIDDTPIIEEGGFLPEDSAEADEEEGDDFVSPGLSKADLAEYITRELADILAERQQQEQEEGEGGEWMDNAIDDTQDDLTDSDEAEWQLNPFLRELILRYKQSQLSTDKRADDSEDEFDDYEYPDDSNTVTSYSPVNTVKESCPAVEQLSDNCAYAEALGWTLDKEAIELCNRHLLCYLCGAEHNLSANVCDKGYLGEAYTSCESQDNVEDCMSQADFLFELMYKTHPYSPNTGARYSCKAKCTLDYITGELQD